jgi:hypothetical protein
MIILLLYVKNKKEEVIHPDIHWGIYLVFLSIITVFYYFPFRNIGYPVEDKYLYAWLFGHDFINRLVHSISLSQGIPLQSYHFSGETLNYYWLSYIFPSFLYNVKWLSLDIAATMKISLLLYGILMYSAFYLFLNSLCTKTIHIVFGLVISFIGYSYSYMYLVVKAFGEKFLTAFSSPFIGQDLSIFTGFSHSYYRFFLVEPQATVGIGLVLLILAVFGLPASLFTRALLGMCVGLLFGVEATLGIMLLASGGLYYSYRLVYWKEKRKETLISTGISCVVAGFFYMIFFAIGMFSFKTGAGVLKVKPNLFSILLGLFYFPISYGPSMILGLAGVAHYVKYRGTYRADLWDFLLILLAVALFFIFFIVNPTESHFGLLKATRLVPVCLITFTIYFMEKSPTSKLVKYGLPVLAILALPNFFTDTVIASNVHAKGSTFIRVADINACRWIKDNTAPGVIVQAEPNHPGNHEPYAPVYYYSLIPIFAERPTAIGEWKVSSQEHAKPGEVGERHHAIRRMFGTVDPNEALGILRKYGIDYVYLSRLEKFLYPEGVSKFYNSGRLFIPVYSRDGVEIFRVALNQR